MRSSLSRFALSLMLAGALFGTTAKAVDEPFKPETFDLPNGMQVVVIPDPRAPVVTHMVWFRTGSTDDPRNAGGIAHFFEHLMFRGTPKHPDGNFDQLISRAGGDNNANTSYDRTVYFERVAKEHLGLAMELDADRMQNLNVDDKTVLTERPVILEERNMRTDNNPTALFWEQMNAAMYLAHPYGTPVIGWRSQIEGLTPEKARSFFSAHYGPNNAILVVAGDVTMDEVKKLAEQYYGPLPARTLEERVRPQEPPPRAARRIAMKDAHVNIGTFSRIYLVPSYKSQTNNEAYALELMAYILGGSGDNSRLGLALIKRDKLCSSVQAWYDGDGIDDKTFGVYGVPAQGEELAEVEKSIDAELTKFIAEGPSDEELTRAKNVLVANAIYAKDSQEGLANYYGEGLAEGLTLDDLNAWPDRIAAVTGDQVKAVAAKYLKMERSVSGTLEPDGSGNVDPNAPPPAPPTGAMQ